MSVPIIYVPTFSLEIINFISEIHHKERPVLITYDISYSDKEYVSYIVFYVFDKHSNSWLKIMCRLLEGKDLTNLLYNIEQKVSTICWKLVEAKIKAISIIKE